MKREARILLAKATDSVLLAIEHFNRPWNRGRPEAVLVLFDRAFELMLKAAIVHQGGRIREPRAMETIGFETCVSKCLSDAQVRCLTQDEALTVRIINALRDAAQHYVIEVSEQQLYMYTQAGLTLFDKVLRNVFDHRLSDRFPQRVLPVSTNPPRDLGSLMDVEFEDIRNLVKSGSRKKFQARAKLRPFAIIEASLGGSHSQPPEYELGKFAERVSKGENWQNIFPGVKRLRLCTEGNGLRVSLRITKSKGEPIHLVPERAPGATIVGVKRVNELGFYSLTPTALANKISVTMPKTLAIVRYLKLQDDPEYFKEFSFGSSHFKRYSLKALDKIKKELPNLDINEIWNKHKPFGRKTGGGI